MKITVWELPNCVQCNQTKREFDKLGVTYSVRQLNRSRKALESFQEMGLISAPIVETDDRRWSGFRLPKIRSLYNHLKHERDLGINVPLKPMEQVADQVNDEEE